MTGAVLNAEVYQKLLKEKVYQKLPEGVLFQGLRLLKSLYGLKQAGRDWNNLQHKVIRSDDPQRKSSQTEPCIYFKITKECTFTISVHVDDYIVGHNSESCMKGFFEHYKKHVEITISNKCDFISKCHLNGKRNHCIYLKTDKSTG